MQPNVIVINDFSEANGGAAQVALASAAGLAVAGHRVTLFSAVDASAPVLVHPNLTAVSTGQHEIAVDRNRLRATVQGLWNSKARCAMRSVLHDFEPRDSIVHLHGWSKALSSSVVRECMKRGFSIVCTLHDYFVACPNGGFFNFRTGQICRLRAMSTPCILENCDSRSYPQKVWRVARQVVQQRVGNIPGGIRAFISVSAFSRAVLQPYLPAGSRIYEVRNPIVGDRCPPAQPAEGSPFLYVGRFSPEKGGALLAAAASEINCGLVYVGDGAARDEFRRLNNKIQFAGWLPRVEVLRHMSHARALVLPSLWYETQGMVVSEAASLGIPAIVPDTSAARDLVRHEHTGLWFKGGDVSSLRSAMRRLMSTEVARELGRNAYDLYWRDPPTIERHVADLQNVYLQILGHR